jgi:RNA polymerase sigma-70 factor, ECF subfamily
MRPELVEATKLLRSSDPKEVSEAIRLLQSTVYSFSMKVCGHKEDAEDTMQEVLVRSLPYLAKIESPQALAVWLYTVTRNRCWRMRRKPVHAPGQTLSLDELMPDASELGLLLADAAKGPEGLLLEGEQDRLVHKAVLQIPPQYRMVLVLHDMEDLDTDQIAKILSLQPGTVRVRLHRARLYVRKEMSRLLNEIPQTAPQTKTPTKNKPAECRELFANLSEYLDDRVEAKTCEQMRQHIEACPSCIAFLQDLRRAIDRCKNLGVHCAPELGGQLRSLLTREYLRFLGIMSD